ncbi:MAG TPA: VOC family protein [Chitinophagaceae bacterium]|nr:VOC family protein [Chitinophagaceae bacterium]
MPRLTAEATILLVKDVIISSNWYRDKLGFNILGIWGDHTAIIERDGQRIMFYRARPEQITPLWKIADKTSNIYFWVEDIDALYKEFIDKKAKIDFTLYETPWGTKEFGINDPDEYDVTFGEILKI